MPVPSAEDEPPIDVSAAHHMEERALAIAADKARTAEEAATVQRLAEARRVLMVQRATYTREAVACRHARGEIYSAQRVAAINAMGPSLADLERDAQALYERRPDAMAVLRAHAEVHFATPLMSARLNLAHHTPDIAPASREMQRREEAFAATWLAAIGDAAFTQLLHQRQREALVMLRTSTRPMFLVGSPSGWGELGDDDAVALGKAWNKLDELATQLSVAPLSNFITLPDEGEAAGAPAAQVLSSVEALLAGVQSRERKFPSKKATAQALGRVHDALVRLAAQGGRAGFEIDV